MRKDVFDQTELICPRCREAGAEGIVQYPLELGEVLRSEGDFVLEGFLVCSNAECCFNYPVLAGVPIVLKDLTGWWGSEHSKLSCVASDAAEMREFFAALNLGTPLSYADISLASSYMDLHYGTLDDVPASIATLVNPKPFWETVVEMAKPQGSRKNLCALDLGCSVGRYTFELARFSDLAVGMDLNFSAVSSAARFHRTKRVFFERRKHGRCFEKIETSFSPPQNVFFLVGDALNPPFSAKAFDFVSSLNLVDNVTLPLVLIGQMDALLKQGCSLVMGSPYEWRADLCEPSQWLESDELDGAAMVRNILEGKIFGQTGLKYGVVQELMDVPWVLRHHKRHWSLFLLHLLKAKKAEDAAG